MFFIFLIFLCLNFDLNFCERINQIKVFISKRKNERKHGNEKNVIKGTKKCYQKSPFPSHILVLFSVLLFILAVSLLIDFLFSVCENGVLCRAPVCRQTKAHRRENCKKNWEISHVLLSLRGWRSSSTNGNINSFQVGFEEILKKSIHNWAIKVCQRERLKLPDVTDCASSFLWSFWEESQIPFLSFTLVTFAKNIISGCASPENDFSKDDIKFPLKFSFSFSFSIMSRYIFKFLEKLFLTLNPLSEAGRQVETTMDGRETWTLNFLKMRWCWRESERQWFLIS